MCVKFTIFIQMQDNSNLRQPARQKTPAKGKYMYPNLRNPPKNKMSAKIKYFTINFTHLIHKACLVLSTFTKVSAFPSSQSVPSSS
jgi:hypothetical protein